MRSTGSSPPQGFSLVEILVAASIIALSIISVVVFVRKGQEQVVLDKHRRMGRAILQRTFEDSRFDIYNYPNLVTGMDTQNVVIDPTTTPPLTGIFTVRVGNEQTMTGAGASAVVVPFRGIWALLKWNEYGGSEPESLSAEKRVTHGANK